MLCLHISTWSVMRKGLLWRHLTSFSAVTFIACVAWRFCRAGRTSGEAAGREIRARERAPQSPRGFSALARLYYLARPTKTAMLRRLWLSNKCLPRGNIKPANTIVSTRSSPLGTRLPWQWGMGIDGCIRGLGNIRHWLQSREERSVPFVRELRLFSHALALVAAGLITR